jgi:hypothetical protein
LGGELVIVRTRPVMKIWSDFSAIAKLAFVCLIVGFVLGLCSSGIHPLSVDPKPTTSVATPTSLPRWPGLVFDLAAQGPN